MLLVLPTFQTANISANISANILLHSSGKRLRHVGGFAARRGTDGGVRWFAGYDTAKFNCKNRHTRMLLCDLVITLQNATPFTPNVDPNDSLEAVFAKTGQSVAAASHILRDERLFQVLHSTISFPYPPFPGRAVE